MNSKTNSIIFLIIGLVIGGLAVHFCSNYTITEKNKTNDGYTTSPTKPDSYQNDNSAKKSSQNSENDITELTEEGRVISFVKKNHELPDCYITKSEARKAGWNPSSGNLCDVLPGKAIGGDKFSNREKSLPLGNQYFEADVNYRCGNRQTDRIIFTKTGDVWLTKDHYRTFEKK